MASFRQAQTGNRVYNGASQSPNRGQVSARGAQGYLQREMRNKQQFNQKRMIGMPMGQPKGADGKSDNRSTVAAQALNRRRQGTSFQPGQGVNGQQPGQQQQGQQQGPPQGGPAAPAAPAQPQVTINETGQLQLPYSQDFMNQNYDAIDQSQQELEGLNAEAQNQQLEYGQNVRDAGLARDQGLQQNLTGSSAQGAAFSSRYLTGNDRVGSAYNNQMSDLNTQNTNFNTQLGTRRTGIVAALNAQLSRSAQDYADSLGPEAGELGFGNAKQKINNPKDWTLHGSKGDKKGDKGGKGGKKPHRNGPRTHKSGKSQDRIKLADAWMRKHGKKGQN